MEDLQPLKCKGLFGKIFGHSFKAVFETDRENYSAREIIEIATNESFANPFGAYMDKNYQNPAHKPKRVTSVCKGYLCSRCGAFIKDQII